MPDKSKSNGEALEEGSLDDLLAVSARLQKETQRLAAEMKQLTEQIRLKREKLRQTRNN